MVYINKNMNMEFNKVIFVNATFGGSIHEMIDSSLIVEFAEFSHDVDVFFLSSRANVIEDTVRSLRPKRSVKFFKIYNTRKESAYRDLIGAIIEAWLLVFKSNKKSLFVCSFANRFSKYTLNFLSKLLKRKVVLCAHVDLETVTYKRKGNYWYLVNRFYTHQSLSPYLRILVLGDNILQNLKEYILEDRLRFFISTDHPYYSAHTDTNHMFNSKTMHIGVVGSITQGKQRGGDNLLNFVKAMRKFQQIEIHIISRVHKDLMDKITPFVHIENAKGAYLSKEEYERFISNMDYLYYPYPSDCFKLTASGAIFESIVNKKPALMYSNSYFKYLNQKYGRFGYFIDEFESLDELVTKLGDLKEYTKLCNSTEQITNRIHPKELYKTLESELVQTYNVCTF